MNEERIPSEVFDWLMTKDFDALSEAQKRVVQACMLESDYRAMHAAASVFKDDMQPKALLPDKDNILQNVLAEKSRSKRRGVLGFFMTPIPLWKAAACIVFLLAILQWPTFEKNGESSGFVSLADTIYITMRDTITLVKRDTVWKETVREASRYAENIVVPNTPSQRLENHDRSEVRQHDFHVLEPKDLKNHRFVGRSAANDRAVREIGFVGL